jgi:hypothetical protein
MSWIYVSPIWDRSSMDRTIFLAIAKEKETKNGHGRQKDQSQFLRWFLTRNLGGGTNEGA